MIALITKELRCYARQRRFRRIQLVMLGMLALVLFGAAFELFAYSQTGAQVNVGYGIYSILVVALFIMLLCLALPLQAIEAMQVENQSSNLDLLRMAPLSTWQILVGKLFASIIAAFWTIWLAVPLFWLSIYAGGLAIRQLLTCGLVFVVSISLFSMIGIYFTFFGNPIRARTRSYSTVLLITLLPLILSHTLAVGEGPLNALRILSPLCVLLSIIGSNPTTLIAGLALWFWMACFYLIVCILMCWFCIQSIAKRGLYS